MKLIYRVRTSDGTTHVVSCTTWAMDHSTGLVEFVDGGHAVYWVPLAAVVSIELDTVSRDALAHAPRGLETR